ncbi:hypothetical protein GCM10017714_09680 [Curtobacterium pusillum]|nr:hypothetical protein GCM10017610_05150 [Curtobacterium pusillum]
MNASGLRRAFPALSSLLPAISDPTWEMDYADVSEVIEDALEGFSVQSAGEVHGWCSAWSRAQAD